MTKLEKIEGIGAKYSSMFQGVGIATQEQLLEMGKTPKGRKDLATSTGISGKLILKWVNRADLARIKGVGEEYADLLEASGVDTVPELAQRNPENLHQKMTEVNDAKNLVRRMPPADQVAEWVAQAKTLPRVVTY